MLGNKKEFEALGCITKENGELECRFREGDREFSVTMGSTSDGRKNMTEIKRLSPHGPSLEGVNKAKGWMAENTKVEL